MAVVLKNCQLRPYKVLYYSRYIPLLSRKREIYCFAHKKQLEVDTDTQIVVPIPQGYVISDHNTMSYGGGHSGYGGGRDQGYGGSNGYSNGYGGGANSNG